MKALNLFKKANKKGEKNYEKIFNIFISNVYDSILDYKNYKTYIKQKKTLKVMYKNKT